MTFPRWGSSSPTLMLHLLYALLATARSSLKAQRETKRPTLANADRTFWVALCGLWPDWQHALILVKPETVMGWHRKGFKLYWTWKSRNRGGRPPIDAEIRMLIRRMAREHPTWGAPRIHGELLKLGFEVGEATVSRYMPLRRKPPSQNWRTFLRNHSLSPADRMSDLRLVVRQEFDKLDQRPRVVVGDDPRVTCGADLGQHPGAGELNVMASAPSSDRECCESAN